MPTENLVTPDVVRRLCWDWQPVADTETAVDDFLREAQVRARGSASSSVPVLTTALTPTGDRNRSRDAR